MKALILLVPVLLISCISAEIEGSKAIFKIIPFKSGFIFFYTECVLTECQNIYTRNAKCMARHFKDYDARNYRIVRKRMLPEGCGQSFAKYECCLVPR